MLKAERLPALAHESVQDLEVALREASATVLGHLKNGIDDQGVRSFAHRGERVDHVLDHRSQQ